MDNLAHALIAFVAAATIFIVTPGPDSALVLRTSVVEGARSALSAGLGVCAGSLTWGFAVAVGLGALLSVSELAFVMLKWIGAAYLTYLGVHLLLHPRGSWARADNHAAEAVSSARAFRRGYLCNILNPKVGAFYAALLPQFVPPGMNPPLMIILLAAIATAMAYGWFLVIVAATRPVSRALQRPSTLTRLDRATGAVFLMLAAHLVAAEQR